MHAMGQARKRISTVYVPDGKLHWAGTPNGKTQLSEKAAWACIRIDFIGQILLLSLDRTLLD